MKASMAKLVLAATVLSVAVPALLVGGVQTAEAAQLKSFCEYGTAISLQLGAGGAIWEQTWGGEPNDWSECEAEPNVGFLGRNAVGILETTTAGAPIVGPDTDWILTFPFGGGLRLMEYDEDDSGKVVGEIYLAVDGIFTADLNADRAIVDEETITVRFGYPIGAGPDAYATIVETSGKFKNINQEEGIPWGLTVSGTITIVRVSEWSLQTNILRALGDADLLLSAEEEIVLSGSYYRGSPNK